MKGIIISVIVLGAIAILLFTQKPEKIKTRPVVVEKESRQEVQAVRNTDYQIMTSDTNEFKNAVYLDVLIQEKLTVDEMIAIAHKERISHGGTAHVQVGFRYFSNNNPYYGVANYNIDCSACTEKDEDGEPISAQVMYKEPTLPETINNLPDGVRASNVIARFYDHGWGQNALIAYTNDLKTSASYFNLYNDAKSGETKLTPQDNMVFKVIETGAKYQILNDRVEYIQTNGNISYTYQILK
ncbi:hypothetical protein [Dyadobacter sp. 3J3]|uniref:hypothetical protein n=1 Tax=Dyadobacter sp. 3J3 TaxID=2606600 RepID=UPI0013591AC5|nr:hypothetical protein [Dyadobacter sp. 3J3]